MALITRRSWSSSASTLTQKPLPSVASPPRLFGNSLPAESHSLRFSSPASKRFLSCDGTNQVSPGAPPDLNSVRRGRERVRCASSHRAIHRSHGIAPPNCNRSFHFPYSHRRRFLLRSTCSRQLSINPFYSSEATRERPSPSDCSMFCLSAAKLVVSLQMNCSFFHPFQVTRI